LTGLKIICKNKRHIRTMYETWLCEIGDSHSGVNEYKSFLGYNVSMGKQLLTFVRPLQPPFSGLKTPTRRR